MARAAPGEIAASPKRATAQQYWDGVAGTYHRDFAGTLIGRLHREIVWRELQQVFTPEQRILELNCGTGVDAEFLASRRVRVVACDISPGMIDAARERTRTAPRGYVELRVLATEDLHALEGEALFDGAFSNFSGLNCVRDLSQVGRKLGRLLKPGATLVTCLLGRFVPWEIAWCTAHGDFRKGLRRLLDKEILSGGGFTVHHYSRLNVVQAFAADFKLQRWQGVGIAVPPSYMEEWAQRFPDLTRALGRADIYLAGLPLVRSMANCILFTFERAGHA